MKTDPRAHWDDRYRTSAGPVGHAAWLDEISDLLPEQGSMLDVAGGGGRNALWFAALGLDVTVMDISSEALLRASASAAGAGLTIECINRDVETDGLPLGRTWDVALMHLFLDRHVLTSLPSVVAHGGLLLFAQPTVVNLERHDRPGRDFLMKLGELTEIADAMIDAEVVSVSEGWEASGRHEARLVARKI